MGQNLTKARSNSTSVQSGEEIKYDSKAKNSISSPDGAWKFITSQSDEFQEAELVVGDESDLIDSNSEKKPIPSSEHDVKLELNTQEHDESSMLHIDDSASSSENHYFPSVKSEEDHMRETNNEFGSTSSFSSSSSDSNLINDPIISTNLSVPCGLNLINSDDTLMQKKLIQNFIEAVPPCTPIKEDLDISVTESLTSPTSQRLIEDVLLSNGRKVPLAQQEQSFSEANNVSIKLETLFDKLTINRELKEEFEEDFYKKDDLFEDPQAAVAREQIQGQNDLDTQFVSLVVAEIISTEVLEYHDTLSIEEMIETETYRVPETSPAENEPAVEITEPVQQQAQSETCKNLTETSEVVKSEEMENNVEHINFDEKKNEIVRKESEPKNEVTENVPETAANDVFSKLLNDLAHSSLIEHRFEFNNEINQFYETIHDIKVAGSFNNWCEQLPMHQLETNTNIWVKDLYLSPGNYEYKFVVNGQWICDKVMPVVGLNNLATVKRA